MIVLNVHYLVLTVEENTQNISIVMNVVMKQCCMNLMVNSYAVRV